MSAWLESRPHAESLYGVSGVRYRLDRCLRHGLNSDVWSALALPSNDVVAVKIINSAAGMAVSGITGEIRSLRSLPERRIARLLDTGRCPDGRDFLVTEFV